MSFRAQPAASGYGPKGRPALSEANETAFRSSK
jgi:hypothetical protein